MDIAGAETPSDKVRALLADARKRSEGFSDYSSCLAMVQEMLAPTHQRLRAAEHRERVHSELVLELTQWMPEALAFLLTDWTIRCRTAASCRPSRRASPSGSSV